MKNNSLGNLRKISDNYRATVDSLSGAYTLECQNDLRFSDEIKAKRLSERNARFNAEIDLAAKKATEKAASEISVLREALKSYITSSSDPDTLSTLQSLIAGGVELSNAEIDTFANGAGYAILRLLEKPSHGKIQAPDVGILEGDLKDLERHFKNISAYRGELTSIGTGGYLGQQSTAMGNVIMQVQMERLPQKMEEISNRWSFLEDAPQI